MSDETISPDFPCSQPRPSFEEVLCATRRSLERARRDPEYLRALLIKAEILDEEGNLIHHEMAGYPYPWESSEGMPVSSDCSDAHRKAESTDSAENRGLTPNCISDQILGNQRPETQIAQHGVQLNFDF